jgi:ATP-dependent helicase/nuclease subunit A
LARGYRKSGVRLWTHLTHSREPATAQTVEQLLDLLRRADFEPPAQLLHWLLVGPWAARFKLVARLGREANDPIDELLNAAMAYATGRCPAWSVSSSGSTAATAN